MASSSVGICDEDLDLYAMDAQVRIWASTRFSSGRYSSKVTCVEAERFPGGSRWVLTCPARARLRQRKSGQVLDWGLRAILSTWDEIRRSKKMINL